MKRSGWLRLTKRVAEVNSAEYSNGASRGDRGRGKEVAYATFGARSTRVGVFLVAGVCMVALFGPYFAPHSPVDLITLPGVGPGHEGLLLGSDYLGRDAWSRFLWGGRVLIGLAAASTVLAYVGGVSVGLGWAFNPRGVVGTFTTGVVDVLIAFPPLLFVLVVLSVGSRSIVMAGLAVAVSFAPRIARIVRGGASEIMATEYVEAAIARGEGTWWILFREVLPNLWPSILADFGVRLSASILIIASVGFLGLGQQPPAADWGLLISENRGEILLQPGAVIAPVIAIGLLSIGVNLIGDGFVRAIGRSG